jgi:hypothetical protein
MASLVATFSSLWWRLPLSATPTQIRMAEHRFADQSAGCKGRPRGFSRTICESILQLIIAACANGLIGAKGCDRVR